MRGGGGGGGLQITGSTKVVGSDTVVSIHAVHNIIIFSITHTFKLHSPCEEVTGTNCKLIVIHFLSQIIPSAVIAVVCNSIRVIFRDASDKSWSEGLHDCFELPSIPPTKHLPPV